MKETKSIRINKTLAEDLKQYTDNIKGVTRTSIIETLIKEFLSKKTISDKGINLTKPFYYNIEDLINNKQVTATKEKPINNFNKWLEVNKIINNLDYWNTEFKTYCFKDIENQHRGIKQLLTVGFKEDKIITVPIYVIFVYDHNAEYEKLRINIIKEKDILYLFNPIQHDNLLKQFLKNYFYFDNAIKEYYNNMLIDNKLQPFKQIYENMPVLINRFDIPYKECSSIINIIYDKPINLENDILTLFEDDKEIKEYLK